MLTRETALSSESQSCCDELTRCELTDRMSSHRVWAVRDTWQQGARPTGRGNGLARKPAGENGAYGRPRRRSDCGKWSARVAGRESGCVFDAEARLMPRRQARLASNFSLCWWPGTAKRTCHRVRSSLMWECETSNRSVYRLRCTQRSASDIGLGEEDL